ncbi:MAG: phosphoglycerate mutase family protein [Actinomycetes bacterium]
MAVYLVRHAHAGSKSNWDGNDAARPLSPKGREQAAGIAELIARVHIDRVLSSPATRCIETIDQVALDHGVVVETEPSLAEGADLRQCIDVILASGSTNLVMCSHGDLIPLVIRRLRSRGMMSADSALCQKGSVWALEVVDGEVVSGIYHPPTRS